MNIKNSQEVFGWSKNGHTLTFRVGVTNEKFFMVLVEAPNKPNKTYTDVLSFIKDWLFLILLNDGLLTKLRVVGAIEDEDPLKLLEETKKESNE